MNVAGVDHVWFWVTDMDRAVGFYRDALGLELVRRYGDEWTEFDAGAVRLGLHGAGNEKVLPHGGTVVFEVDDLDVAKATFEERGLRFDEHLGEVPGLARYASFSDPDGNSMQLIEYTDAEA